MGVEINKELLPMKGHYFLFNAATAPIVPFMPTYARQLGFSSVVVGAIYTILPVTGMLAKPLFGVIADRFHRQKLLFLVFQMLTAAAFFAINFIPEVPQEGAMEMSCVSSELFLKHCQGTNTPCAVESIMAENNGTMRCHLSCPMTSEMWKTVCEDWKGTQYCSTSGNNQENFVFTSVIPLSATLSDVDPGCTFFKVNYTVFDDGTNHFPICREAHNSTHPVFRSNCSATCDSPVVTEMITKTDIQNVAATGLYQFWLFFWMLVLSWIGMAVVVSVGDAICFEMLGDRPHRYGNQRLWGACGWGVFSILAGLLVDEFSKGQSKKNYTIVFYLMLLLLVLDMLVSFRLKHTQTKLSQNILRDVGKLFTSLRIFVFTLWCIVIGFCTGLQWQFLFWHLEDLAMSTAEGCAMQVWIKTLEGLVMGIQSFGGELPFFFLSGWILNRIGHVHAMSLVLLGFGVRFLLYSVLSNPWWVLPIELLQGITFGIFYSTMASYAAIVAPPGTEATIQGLVGAIFEGVGVSLGSLLGGYLFGVIGGAETFRVYGIAALILFLVHVLLQKLLDRSGKQGKTFQINKKKLESTSAPNEQMVEVKLNSDSYTANMD